MEVIPLLTQKQEKYVQNLVAGMSQREAYKDAYNALKMKDSTIDEKASRLLSQDKVRARYEEIMGKVRDIGEQAAIASAVEVLESLTRIAQAKITDYAEIKGPLVTIKQTSDMPLDKIDAIASIEQGNFGIKLKLHDKLKALELLGKYHSLFTEKVEHSGSVTVEKMTDEEAMKHLEALGYVRQ